MKLWTGNIERGTNDDVILAWIKKERGLFVQTLAH